MRNDTSTTAPERFGGTASDTCRPRALGLTADHFQQAMEVDLQHRRRTIEIGDLPPGASVEVGIRLEDEREERLRRVAIGMLVATGAIMLVVCIVLALLERAS